jgi:selenocysteine lyase/cysteine desulfurase
MIITRNTTESLDTVISGFDWKPGDEAVMAMQDYGAMLDQFKLQARRYGLVTKVFRCRRSCPDDEIGSTPARLPSTRLLMISHS